ncbi:DUF4349 domain-containing protein [Desertivirga brevis]|uniref:DUF4349 domain-containing protein n=1 Tax=Desertivirga brevis TaxID=2810310 RepID=UPI001A9753F2|nr:DUF4349 domain-containing protein [Pedobacter sp. SYSU D00873]
MKTIKFSLGMLIALTFAACSANKGNYESDSASADSTSIETSVSDLPATETKLVKTANIEFKVHDVYRSSRHISQSVRSLGGLVTHHNIESTPQGSKTIPLSNDSLLVVSSYDVEAEMTVRIPSNHLEEFVQAIADDATFIKQARLDVDDRSIDFLSSSLKQQSRQKILDAQNLKEKLKTKDALTIADEQDQVIEQKMNNLRTEANTRYSTLELRFNQNTLIKKEAIPNNDLSTYRSPTTQRFGDALATGLNFTLDLIIGITHLWAFIILGIIGWLAYRYFSRNWKQKASSAQ